MKTRRLATIALAAAVILGTSGCSLIAPHATTIEYAAADGINVDAGELAVRNALVVASEDGEQGNFVAAVVNATDTEQSLTIAVDGGSNETIQIPAKTTVSFGTDEDPIALSRLGALPGSTVVIAFDGGGTEIPTADVPVLDGTLPYLSDLVPESPAAGN